MTGTNTPETALPGTDASGTSVPETDLSEAGSPGVSPHIEGVPETTPPGADLSGTGVPKIPEEDIQSKAFSLSGAPETEIPEDASGWPFEADPWGTDPFGEPLSGADAFGEMPLGEAAGHQESPAAIPDASVPGAPVPDESVRRKQLLRLAGAGSLIALVIWGVYGSVIGSAPTSGEHAGRSREKPVEQKASDLGTPLGPVDDREIWVSRVEKKAEAARQEADQIRSENRFLEKRIDVIESLLDKARVSPVPENRGDATAANPTPSPDSSGTDSSGTDASGSGAPGMNSSGAASAFVNDGPASSPAGAALPRRKGPKILHLKGGGVRLSTSSDLYLPAGTYCKAVVDMGVAVSTATNAQGNPEPIRLRLVDGGNLPGGLKGQVKDAVLIGACYGDISSERARCRLETLSWRTKQGATVEKKIEGWIVGEDGVAGIRGKIVDRSGEVAREAFGAGLLSAASNFLKFEAMSPMAPFGGAFGPFGTSASGKGVALSGASVQGALGSGASGALDKLAEFSIRRAEQMSPIVFVASGRVVDVLLKSGVALTPDPEEGLSVVGGSANSLRPLSESPSESEFTPDIQEN